MTSERDQRHAKTVDGILGSYDRHGQTSHLEGGDPPNREAIWGIVEDLLRLLFPGFFETGVPPREEIRDWTADRVESIERRLASELRKGLRLCRKRAIGEDEATRISGNAAQKLLARIPEIRDRIALDIEAAFVGDPAAQFAEEIILAYPGLQAIAVQRLAHVLYRKDIPVVPRVMTEYAHSRTGIDIHPGAVLGERFFIDHGTGVVIGETTTIGNHVKVYQGVTLGAKSFEQDAEGKILKGTKRHPDIGDRVTIYSGATILGAVSIGDGSVIGGNVWLTDDVPPRTKIIVMPAQKIRSRKGGDDSRI
jgi:serine O-acetyltransferase